MLWPGPERTPRSCCMYQNTDGPLQDDQWWTPRAWAVSAYHPCILQWGKAPWQTYGQILQDTFYQANWYCSEPLCHQACSRTSLPQLQTCGCNLPSQALRSPHEWQWWWLHTTCTLQGLPQLHMTASNHQNKLPCKGFQMFQMWQDWALGTEMLCW